MTYDPAATPDTQIDVSAVLQAVVKRLPRIAIISALLLAVTFVILMFMPRLYESTASILVEPRSNAYSRASNDQAPTLTGGEAGVVSSQIELIKSRDTLIKVIDQLDLRSEPEFNGSQSGFSPLGIVMQLMGRRPTQMSIDETVLTTLYERLSVSQERDSAVISVAVQSTDPERAAAIANAVANAHVLRRAELSLSDTADASGWLLEEIERLRVSVREAEAAVAQFRVDNDLFIGQSNTSLLDQQLSTLSAQISTAQERKNTALSRANLIRGLVERGQSIENMADIGQLAVVQQLSQEKVRLQGELAQRSATLLSNHPTIRSLNAQIAELDRQIRAEGRSVSASLEAEAQIEADLEASLQADLARLKSTASTATQDTVGLGSLEREAKAQRDLLEAYLLRYNEASSRVDTNSALPDVRVISVAAPSVTPASPKTTLILIAVAFVSIAVQLGIVIFGELMSGRALVQRSYDGYAPAARREEFEAVEPYAPTETAVAEVEPAPETVPYEIEDAVLEDRAEIQRFDPPVIEPKPAAPARAVGDDSSRAFLRSLMADQGADDVGAEPIAMARAGNDDELPVRPATPRRRKVPGFVRYSEIAADLVLGNTHLVLLADHGSGNPAMEFAEDLVREALSKGLSVALVDAGSGRRGNVPGLSDLSTGRAAFGDVVQKSADNSFAEVVWGQERAVDRNSPRPLTLVEALGDIYEVVVVLTGRVGGQSTLSSFAELGGRIVLVAGATEDVGDADLVRRRMIEAGLPRVEIAALTESVAA